MKKLLALMSASVLVLTSCSNDDNDSSNSSSSDSILIKKMILTSPDEDQDSYWNNTIVFTYNGNKLEEINEDDDEKSKFYYTGDLITKIEHYSGVDLYGQELFSYDSNGKLIEFKDQDLDSNFEMKFAYSYNSNGTVTASEYQGDIDNTSLIFTYTYTFTNDELVSEDHGSGEVYNYAYDDKNNPFQNVTGYKEIMLPEYADDYQIAFGRYKNVLSRTYDLDSNLDIISSYTYNSDNYPVTSTATTNFGSSVTHTVNVQYFYE